MKENQIETYLREQVKTLGGKAYKFVSPGNAGVPDRILLIPPGIIIFVETKAPGKDLKPLQAAIKRKFEALGFRCEKIDTKEQVKQLINEIRGTQISGVHN